MPSLVVISCFLPLNPLLERETAVIAPEHAAERNSTPWPIGHWMNDAVAAARIVDPSTGLRIDLPNTSHAAVFAFAQNLPRQLAGNPILLHVPAAGPVPEATYPLASGGDIDRFMFTTAVLDSSVGTVAEKDTADINVYALMLLAQRLTTATVDQIASLYPGKTVRVIQISNGAGAGVVPMSPGNFSAYIASLHAAIDAASAAYPSTEHAFLFNTPSAAAVVGLYLQGAQWMGANMTGSHVLTYVGGKYVTNVPDAAAVIAAKAEAEGCTA